MFCRRRRSCQCFNVPPCATLPMRPTWCRKQCASAAAISMKLSTVHVSLSRPLRNPPSVSNRARYLISMSLYRVHRPTRLPPDHHLSRLPPPGEGATFARFQTCISTLVSDAAGAGHTEVCHHTRCGPRLYLTLKYLNSRAPHHCRPPPHPKRPSARERRFLSLPSPNPPCSSHPPRQETADSQPSYIPDTPAWAPRLSLPDHVQ